MNKEKQTKIFALLGLIIVALIVGLIFTINQSTQKSEQIAATEQIMEEEKQQMVTEVEDIAGEMDGYTIYVHNDSLLHQFDMQKQKVKELQDELKRTKATDAKRISELKSEIASLRKILAHYVIQIDSLNSLNKKLTSENIEVKQKFQSVSAEAEQLAVEKENLNEVVSRAAILEAYNFNFSALDNRNRGTQRASRMTNLKFNFTVGKNITAEPGMKTIFMRLTRPDEELMTKSSLNTFAYENKNIGYSSSKEIEYTGDAISDVFYWKVEEILQVGTYRADFFADGNRIGSFSFRIEKK